MIELPIELPMWAMIPITGVIALVCLGMWVNSLHAVVIDLADRVRNLEKKGEPDGDCLGDDR